MMKRPDYFHTDSFDIYTPVKKIYFTPDLIVLSLAVIFTVPILFEHFVFDAVNSAEYSVLSNIFLVCLTCLMLAVVVLRIGSHIRYKPLKGIINGEIQFENDYITVNGMVYKIAEMSRLELYMYDFQGQDYKKYRKTCNGQLSNGIDNAVIFHYPDKKAITTYIRQFRQYDRLHLRPQLINYCRTGKLKFDDLVKLLAIEYGPLTDDLKKEIYQ